jgi:hypothetical protein
MAEPFLPLPVPRERVAIATRFRSTWLTSSLRSLEKRSLLDSYFRALPEVFHDAVRNCIVGEWLSIDVALAHYAAADTLGLSAAQLVEVGKETTQYAHATVFGTIVRAGRAAGATPWTIFSHQQRLWERVWIGGAVAITKTGPKDAVIEIVGWPCARYHYVRAAFRGVIVGQCELVCLRAFAVEVSRECTPTSLTYKVSWV